MSNWLAVKHLKITQTQLRLNNNLIWISVKLIMLTVYDYTKFLINYILILSILKLNFSYTKFSMNVLTRKIKKSSTKVIYNIVARINRYT